MNELKSLQTLARTMGVHSEYSDGLGRSVNVQPETLVRVCASLGAPVSGPGDAGDALRSFLTARDSNPVAPVVIAWEGVLAPVRIAGNLQQAELLLESGEPAPIAVGAGAVRSMEPLAFGYHRLTVDVSGATRTSTIIAAPERAFRHGNNDRSWGVGTHLAALRSGRSRSLGDLRDLETLSRWVGSHGGDLVTMLPLLPTFNDPPAEPSPYAAVSRLFWSELLLDLGDAHQPSRPAALLDVARADTEVRRALAGQAAPPSTDLDDELIRYARFRGAQARFGRNWRVWPDGARDGVLTPEHFDADEERFHLVAQTLARGQLADLRRRLDEIDVRLGLDLAVGCHPDGYDTWSRQELFAREMSVGAPPDPGFPSGQDWGFAPVHPEASRREGHQYLAASIAHQATLARVLRVDHVMALTRLYWIPHGAGKHDGTYVSYPVEELFAIMTLESHRNRCEVVGENLGTVPPEIYDALPRHGIRGMYLAMFESAESEVISGPGPDDVALIGTHDTPTLAGWVAGADIGARVRCGLLDPTAEEKTRSDRLTAVRKLAGAVGSSTGDTRDLIEKLLDWLGESSSPLVIPWIEDLWLENEQVNLPGTTSAARPNWQRPMARLLDDILADPAVAALVDRLDRVRKNGQERS